MSDGASAGQPRHGHATPGSGTMWQLRGPDGTVAAGWYLVPLRLFLGVTFVFAGLQKLANPDFFRASSPISIHAQLVGSSRTSPIGGLLGHLVGSASGIGALIAVAEVAIGVGALLGLLDPGGGRRRDARVLQPVPRHLLPLAAVLHRIGHRLLLRLDPARAGRRRRGAGPGHVAGPPTGGRGRPGPVPGRRPRGRPDPWRGGGHHRRGERRVDRRGGRRRAEPSRRRPPPPPTPSTPAPDHHHRDADHRRRFRRHHHPDHRAAAPGNRHRGRFAGPGGRIGRLQRPARRGTRRSSSSRPPTTSRPTTPSVPTPAAPSPTRPRPRSSPARATARSSTRPTVT